jgi:hypothetical protein
MLNNVQCHFISHLASRAKEATGTCAKRLAKNFHATLFHRANS